MRGPLSNETKRTAYEEDTRWGLKALLRLIASFIAFVSMCFFAASISYTNENFENLTGNGDWTDGMTLAPIILSLIYNPIAVILHLIFRRGRHFHPAMPMALDFVIWGLCLPSIIFSIGGGMFWYWSEAIPNADNGTVDCSFLFNQFSMSCNPIVYRIGNLQIAGAVGLIVLFFIHITLFTFAAMDLHRRRRALNMGLSEKNSFEMQYKSEESSQHQHTYSV